MAGLVAGGISPGSPRLWVRGGTGEAGMVGPSLRDRYMSVTCHLRAQRNGSQLTSLSDPVDNPCHAAVSTVGIPAGAAACRDTLGRCGMSYVFAGNRLAAGVGNSVSAFSASEHLASGRTAQR